jgi:hypothetical protein
MESPGTLNSESNLKRDKVGGLLPDSQICLHATVIKIVWYWQKARQMDKQNKI